MATSSSGALSRIEAGKLVLGVFLSDDFDSRPPTNRSPIPG